ncbi:MAG: MFS transporter [Gemmatimonadota bacterium]
MPSTQDGVIGRAFAHPMQARVAIAAVFFLNGVSVASWVVRIPDVQHALSLSAGALGVALLAAAAGALVAMPIAGRLVGRRGSRPVTVAMALAYGATLALPAIAPTLPLLVVALLFNGAANGSLNVALNAHASLVAGRLRRPLLASFHALFSGGGLAGAALGGLVAGFRVSATVHLTVVGLLMGVVVLLARRAMLAPMEEQDVTPDVVHAIGHRPRVRVLVLGTLAFTVLFAEGAMGDWSAVYLRDVAGAGPALVASGYAAFSVMMALGRMVGDRMTEWLGASRLVGLGGALAAAGVTLALLHPTTTAIAVGFGAVGAGLATAFPSVISAASRITGTPAGDGIARVATLGYFGLLAGPPIIGFVAQGTSLRGGMVAVGAACLLSAFLARTLRETVPTAVALAVPTPLV